MVVFLLAVMVGSNKQWAYMLIQPQTLYFILAGNFAITLGLFVFCYVFIQKVSGLPQQTNNGVTH